MKKIILGLVGLTAVTLALSACEKEDKVTYETNNMVVHEDTDECPRADGQPCK